MHITVITFEFEDIIKNKVAQFTIPFNENHWMSLEQKLTPYRKSKRKKY